MEVLTCFALSTKLGLLLPSLVSANDDRSNSVGLAILDDELGGVVKEVLQPPISLSRPFLASVFVEPLVDAFWDATPDQDWIVLI